MADLFSGDRALEARLLVDANLRRTEQNQLCLELWVELEHRFVVVRERFRKPILLPARVEFGSASEG